MKIIPNLLAGFVSLFIFAMPLLATTVVRPTLTLVNLKAGLRWSNDVFTVQGRAAGSAGISNVLYSLNGGTWGSADPGNQWTNWSATITLIPGTNIFSAYAVDNRSICSLTNTVRLDYVVKNTMTVRTNGNGSISPSYNGAQLLLGTAYSMKATAANNGQSGFGFRYWTDGSNNIVTNKATIKFTMASNLTLVANFGDVTPPVLVVISTTANTNGIPNDFIIHGHATDNVGVTNVFYYLNNSSSNAAAVTSNQWTNWDASVELQPGVNSFYAYALDTNGNRSQLLVAHISYNSAPVTLSGQAARATVNSDNNVAPFTLAFGKSTFSQAASDTNNPNAVGSYTYLGSGGTGILKVKYTAPPVAASWGSRSFQLLFVTPAKALFSTTNLIATNIVVTSTNNSIISTNIVSTNRAVIVTGSMFFSPATNLCLSNAVGQLIWTFSRGGDGTGAAFQKSTYATLSLITGSTNAGSYTYTQYSPVGAMFKLTHTNGTTYLLANFAATNYGTYYTEDYTQSGQTNGTDDGRFLIASQLSDGNAPLTLTNRNFEIFSGKDSFNEQFAADTYSQDTLSTNFDNAVGSYFYERADTNVGQLSLTVTEPPTLAGSNSSARLIFVGGNIGFFTNEDSTFSTFILTSVTNLAPPALTNISLNINYDAGGSDSINLTNDGSFFLSSQPGGTYNYAAFSPGGAMIQLDINTNNFANASPYNWLQLNFKTTNSGNIFLNQFDSNTNFSSSSSGTFTLH